MRLSAASKAGLARKVFQEDSDVVSALGVRRGSEDNPLQAQASQSGVSDRSTALFDPCLPTVFPVNLETATPTRTDMLAMPTSPLPNSGVSFLERFGQPLAHSAKSSPPLDLHVVSGRDLVKSALPSHTARKPILSDVAQGMPDSRPDQVSQVQGINAASNDKARASEVRVVPTQDEPASKIRSDSTQSPNVSLTASAFLEDVRGDISLGRHTVEPLEPERDVSEEGDEGLEVHIGNMPDIDRPLLPSSTNSAAPKCLFDKNCKNATCKFWHASKASVGRESVDSLLRSPCAEGAQCLKSGKLFWLQSARTNPISSSTIYAISTVCSFWHPSPAVRYATADLRKRVPCYFGSNCNRQDCTYFHPNSSDRSLHSRINKRQRL